MTTTTAGAPGPMHVADRRPSTVEWSRRVFRRRPEDPGWVRPALITLLAATAAMYSWNLDASGWGNSYYMAAVQAGADNWKAMFFGSFDSANFITVDKTPASLWVMSASARLFGFNSWSVLVPQAAMGVGTVWLLYASVRRYFGAGAGLLAGAALATTPVAVLMFRYNNPDALLVLLLVGAAYAVLRATETAAPGWLAVAGALVGFAFLAKMLQAFLVVPVFAIVYLVVAPTSVGKRLLHLAAAGLSMLVAGGWWVAIVALWPASSRPYIGGSTNNSILELTLGYNGLGRLTGDQTGSVGGGPAGTANRWGTTGWSRLFTAEMGGQIAWLLPTALAGGVVLLWLTRSAPRTDGRRAAVLLWVGWVVTTAGVFSFMRGIFHAYYNVALAPAIAALVGMTAAALWQCRTHVAARLAMAVLTVGTAGWAYMLLSRSRDFAPPVRTLVLAGGVLAGLLLTVPQRYLRRAGPLVAAFAVAASIGGPAAHAVNTAVTPHTGSIPSAGPEVASSGAGFRGMRNRPPGDGGQPGTAAAGGTGPLGAPGAASRAPGAATAGRPGGGFGGMGGLLDAQRASSELVSLLKADARFRWSAAMVGANNAAGVQLTADMPVMAIGGFNGTDHSPTLAEFQAHVAAGAVHYFISGGRGFGGDSGGAAAEIASWVSETYAPRTVGGTTVYDLTQPAG